MKDSIKMIASIVAFATAVCVGLSVVYEKTKEPIKEAQYKNIRFAQKALFPDAEFEELAGLESAAPQVAFNRAYAARENGELTGVIIESEAEGFSAPLAALVGIKSDGTIAGVQIVKNTDTPGLGSHAGNPKYFIDKPLKTKTFYGQFAGMSAGNKVLVEKDGGEVVAITAATISSRAVALLVDEALRRGYEWIRAQGGAR